MAEELCPLCNKPFELKQERSLERCNSFNKRRKLDLTFSVSNTVKPLLSTAVCPQCDVKFLIEIESLLFSIRLWKSQESET